MHNILLIFGAFFALRLLSLAISIRNERRIRRQGAVQYGARNSLALTLAHLAFYASALVEAYGREATLTPSAWVGVGMMAFAYAMLFVVIYCLRDLWTVKLYILPHHRIERSWLFRHVRHPNYFLNILPELVGTALLCSATYTLIIGLPLYLVPLIIRIRQEERAMQHLFSAA